MLCFMTLEIDAKLEDNYMKNLANFLRLKNSNFILESKMAELNQNKNSKQLDRPDSVRKLFYLKNK